MTKQHLFRFAMLLGLAALTPTAPAATEVFSYSLRALVEQRTSSTGPVTTQQSGSNSSGSGTARSSADFGVLKVYAESHAVNNGSAFNTSSAAAQASFKDDVTISAPGLNGTQGSVTVKYRIDGNLTASSPGGDTSRESSTAAAYYFRRNGSTLGQAEYTVAYNGSTTGENFLNRDLTATFSFTYGTPFELHLFIETSTLAYNLFGADCLGDLYNTASWGGFLSVQDAGGNVVTNFTTTSGSGANYSQPILPPPPRVSSVRLQSGNVVIQWPTNLSAFQLESTTNLFTSNWSTVTNPPTVSGSDYVLSIPTISTVRFFRLRRP